MPPHACTWQKSLAHLMHLGERQIGIVGAVLLRWVLTYMRRMIAGLVSLGIEYDLRKLLYGHLRKKPNS